MSTTEQMSLSDMRKFEGTLFIRNNTNCTVTFNEQKEQFILGHKGSDSAIQVMPRRLLDMPGFQRMLMRGKVTVSPDLEEEATAGVMRATAEADRNLTAMHEAMQESPQNRDLVERECLVCHDRTFLTEIDVRDHVAPLCSQHKELEREFAYREDYVDGQSVDRWDRVRIG